MFKLAGLCPCFLGLAIVLAGGEAIAQSTSTCIAIGPNMVHCDTMDMGPPPTVQSGPDGGEELGRGLARFVVRTREDAFRRRVGKLLADGDCQGAARMALESGRLELGQSIMSACSPNGAPGASAHPQTTVPRF